MKYLCSILGTSGDGVLLRRVCGKSQVPRVHLQQHHSVGTEVTICFLYQATLALAKMLSSVRQYRFVHAVPICGGLGRVSCQLSNVL